MNIKMLKAALAGLIISVSGIANAGLIKADFMASGDELLVLDQDTNYEWALVTNTGSTINEFLNSSIYSGHGFTIATGQDLLTLWTNGGATNLTIGVGNFDAANEAPADFIATLFGHTSPYSEEDGNTYVHGLFDNNNGSYDLGRIGGGDSNSTYFSYFDIGNNNFSNVGPDYYCCEAISVWAYREASSVPEPSTLAIFALGIMGLASRRFMKKS